MPFDPYPDFYSVQIAEAKRFHLNLTPPRETPLAVVSGGSEHCAADYEIHRSGFPFWGIEFVAQGRGALTLNGKEYPLAVGTLFSYGPEIAQDIVSDPEEPLVKYFLDFTGTRAEALLCEHGPEPGRVVQTGAPAEVMALWEDLIRNGVRHTPFSERIAAVLLECLLLKVAETAIPLGSSGTPAFATYRRVRRWIEAHALELRTLEEVGERCHVDPAYLCRLFRRFDHRTPYQYLLELKMNHAAERLGVEQISVKQVADEMGFEDPYHFSRLFKKVVGLSPGRFTRLLRLRGA